MIRSGREAIQTLRSREAGQWVAPFVLAGVVTSLLSIFLSGLCMFLAFVAWVLDCRSRGRIHLAFPPFTPIILLFLGLVVISIAFSSDLAASLWYLKKFVRYFSIFLIFTYFTRRHVILGIHSIFLVILVSALLGLLQYFWWRDVHLMNRIDGFMSHWMTFSGQLMMGAVALTIYLGLSRWHRVAIPAWFRGVLICGLPLLYLTTIVTFTRSAWIGLAGGLLAFLVILRIRWALFGALALVVLFLLAPEPIKNRFYSSFDLTDTTTVGRLALLQTGVAMISDHPLTGVGPRLLQDEALRHYRVENEMPDDLYQHLHNNLLQIAAEVGLPAALVWLFFWVWLIRDFWRFRNRRDEDGLLAFLGVGALCVLVAVQLMGFFEYNFGDSEIVIMLLFWITVPYVVESREADRGAGIQE